MPILAGPGLGVRLVGPDDNNRLAYIPTSTGLNTAIGATATVYADSAGTTLADILAYQPSNPAVPGVAIAGSTLTVDVESQVPQFWYPLDQDTVWVRIGSGPLVGLHADYDARIDALTATLAGAETTTGAQAKANAALAAALAADGLAVLVQSVAGRIGNVVLTVADVSGALAVREAPTTPLRYGAVGNGSTLDDAAFTAMMAALPAAGAHVYLPSGYNFLLSSPITLTGNASWSGGGATARITNHSSDVFTVASNLAWMHMRDFRVDSGGGGGHIFSFGALGTSKSTFDNLTLIQNVPDRAIFKSAFWLDNTIKSCNLFGAAGRSVPMIWLVSTSDNLGDNTFEDLTLTDAGSVSPSIAPATTWAIWLEEQSATLAYSNKFRGINFENCAGGALTLRGHINYLVESCEFWDLITPATNHLFYGAAGGVSGLPNRDGRISKTIRCSGTLGSGICDIAFGPVGSEFNTVVREIHGTSLVQVIDLQHNIGCRIEDCTNIAAQSSYAPIYAAQSAAGSGAMTALDPNVSNLYSAGCLLTTGTSPTTGDLVNISANANGWLTAAPASVMLTARNAAAAQAGLYVSAQSATSFTVAAANAPSASTALKFSYNIVRAINGG